MITATTTAAAAEFFDAGEAKEWEEGEWEEDQEKGLPGEERECVNFNNNQSK
jgi:hypothetical protein